MKRALLLLAAAALLTGGVTVAALATPPTDPPGQGECEHGNSGQECKPDPQPGHGQDCDEHGPFEGGVNEDHCLPETTPTDTIPTDTTPTTPTETTPTTPTTETTHDCVFVGADKDGGTDAQGGTNDDCAPAPTTTTVPKPAEPVAATITPLQAAAPVQPVAAKVPTKVKAKAKTKAKVKVKVHTAKKAAKPKPKPKLTGNPKTDKCKPAAGHTLNCKGIIVVPGNG